MAEKPILNYKETQDRKARANEEDESPTAVQEFPERVESSDESEGTMIEDDMREIENLEKQLDQAKRLLQTIDDKDEQFPECLKG